MSATLAKSESEWPTDEEIMKLLPEDLHKEFANWSRIYADQAGTKPGIFRVILNTLALDFARAVLDEYGNYPVSPDSSPLKQLAMGALYAIASGADDTREFYQDIETIKLALEQLK